MSYKETEKYTYYFQKKIDDLIEGKIRFLDKEKYVRDFFQGIMLEF
jgi:hypothetical protein